MFEDDKLYLTSDPALKAIGPYSDARALALRRPRAEFHQDRLEGRLSRLAISTNG